jgi:hypothetical protein
MFEESHPLGSEAKIWTSAEAEGITVTREEDEGGPAHKPLRPASCQ